MPWPLEVWRTLLTRCPTALESASTFWLEAEPGLWDKEIQTVAMMATCHRHRMFPNWNAEIVAHMNPEEIPVLIVGAGGAGLSLSLLLLQFIRYWSNGVMTSRGTPEPVTLTSAPWRYSVV
jgi:hypothetical protein